MAEIVWRGLVAALGVAALVLVLASAVRTLVLPRGLPSRISRLVFLVLEGILRLVTARRGFRHRDAAYAGLGPAYLLVMLGIWLTVVLVAFVGIIEAVRPGPLVEALELSGSSLATLGVVAAPGALTVVSVVEALVGLMLLALLIGYLPTVYTAFSRREAVVDTLALRAGLPLHGPALLVRSWRLDHLQSLPEVFQQWTVCFINIAESHVSFPVLSWLRSPQPRRSWITASGAVLDAAALLLAAVLPGRDAPDVVRRRVADAELCLTAGVQTLRRIAAYHAVPRPAADSTLLLSRAAFDAAMRVLREAGLPVRDDDVAWTAFAARRNDYDRVLVALAAYLVAPPAPWSADLAVGTRHRPPLLDPGTPLAGQPLQPHLLPGDLAAAAELDQTWINAANGGVEDARRARNGGPPGPVDGSPRQGMSQLETGSDDPGAPG